MTKKDIEQVILVVWTFIITTLDAISFVVYDNQEFSSTNTLTLIIATILSAFVYYLIGSFILFVLNSIHKFIRR